MAIRSRDAGRGVALAGTDGAGPRGGWYSYDWLDNGRQPGVTRIVPGLQHPLVGTIFRALPHVTEGFVLLAIEPPHMLMLGIPAPDGTPNVTWTFVLDEVSPGVTRLLVRVRGGPGYHGFHGALVGEGRTRALWL